MTLHYDTDTSCAADAALRAYADNVVIVMEPQPTATESGIAIVHTRASGARESRAARVLRSGPGYHKKCCGGFEPNEVQEGQRVLVDALCGQNFDLDISAPRQNKSAEFQELVGERGEFRVVRHDEVLAVLDEGVRVG